MSNNFDIPTITKKLINDELRQLSRVIDKLYDPTTPPTPLPRPKTFLLRLREASFEWPSPPSLIPPGYCPERMRYIAVRSYNNWEYACWIYDLPVTNTLSDVCKTPRDVVAVLRYLRSIRAWCEARIRGRHRAAMEILKQQEKFVKILQAEHAVNALSKGGNV